MSRIYATQEQVHTSIVTRLIDRIDEYDEMTCFVSDEPYPLIIPPSDVFCTVSPGDGVFDERMFASAGENQLTESSDVSVSFFISLGFDQSGRQDTEMFSPQKGLITYFKREILRAIVRDAWEPTYNGNELLRNMIRPIRFTRPQRFAQDEGNAHLGAELTFATDFDWSL